MCWVHLGSVDGNRGRQRLQKEARSRKGAGREMRLREQCLNLFGYWRPQMCSFDGELTANETGQGKPDSRDI